MLRIWRLAYINLQEKELKRTPTTETRKRKWKNNVVCGKWNNIRINVESGMILEQVCLGSGVILEYVLNVE